MNRLFITVVSLGLALQLVQAATSFEVIWANQSRETISLLRMVGIVAKEDLDRLDAEEKTILLLAFDDDGNLTAFGQRLLSELASARLSNPNRNVAKRIRASDDLRFRARRLERGFRDEHLGYERAYGLVAEPFSGRLERQLEDYPVVYSGMHDWNLPLPEGSFGERRVARAGEIEERVRILVTPKFPVRRNRYNINREKNSEELTREALSEVGISYELLKEHDAHLIYTLNLPNIVNVLSVEVPKDKARALALALEARGHAAKPVTRIALLSAPETASPNPSGRGHLLGLVGSSFQRLLSRTGAPVRDAGSFQPSLSESVGMLRPNKFYQAGLHGERAVAVIVDSSLDLRHPDFVGKRIIQRDFTQDQDGRDYVGHGSHVASIALGTGEASQEKYRGVAYGTQEVIVPKIFGKSAYSSEDTIIAGIVWAIEEARGRKVVVNLSLGGRGDNNDALSRVVNNLAHQGHAVVVAAGNSGPREGNISSPGVARDALTVAATDKKGYITGYSSRGNRDGYQTPSRERVVYLKPDLAAPGGDVRMSLTERFLRGLRRYFDGPPQNRPLGIDQAQRNCVYEHGIIAAKSSDSAASSCDIAVDGKPLYTRMAGTSMATPHMTGVNLIVYDYLERNGGIRETSFLESKAAQMEASRPLRGANNQPYFPHEQGAGMPDLERLYDLVTSRLRLGLPIGNISAQIAFWTVADPKLRREARTYSSYRATRFGIVDIVNGNVINSDEELNALIEAIERKKKQEGFFSRWWRRFFGRDGREDLLEK